MKLTTLWKKVKLPILKPPADTESSSPLLTMRPMSTNRGVKNPAVRRPSSCSGVPCRGTRLRTTMWKIWMIRRREETTILHAKKVMKIRHRARPIISQTMMAMMVSRRGWEEEGRGREKGKGCSRSIRQAPMTSTKKMMNRAVSKMALIRLSSQATSAMAPSIKTCPNLSITSLCSSRLAQTLLASSDKTISISDTC